MAVERPEHTELERPFGPDVVISREVVGGRPPFCHICVFDKDTGPLPLQIDERVQIRVVAELLRPLIVEHSEIRAITLQIIRSMEYCVGPYLNLKHLFQQVELQIIMKVGGDFR